MWLTKTYWQKLDISLHSASVSLKMKMDKWRTTAHLKNLKNYVPQMEQQLNAMSFRNQKTDTGPETWI